METASPEIQVALQNLIGKSLADIEAIAVDAGHPRFRGKQLYEWIYRHGATSFDQMTSLSKDFRGWLARNYVINFPEIAEVRGSKEDGSQKILFRLADGKIVESVLMQDRDWQSLCISSQVGCAVDCKFCMTGFGGFQRQLNIAEIVGQFMATRAFVNNGVSPRNIVFMGMGEPMLNLDNVIPAIELLVDRAGLEVAPRRITVSTSGILPGLERLAAHDTGVNFAISLNASNDEFRNKIMPINRKYPISKLLEVCEAIPLRSRRRITFEYVLLAGENDSVENARELSALLRHMPCKINLIPWNPDPKLPYRRPEESVVRKFQDVLLDNFHTVSVRYSKGVDIGAACGQLAGHYKPAAVAAPVS